MFASNSSTTILIAKATLLSKFLDIGKVAITSVVYNEITQKESFENLAIKREIERGRIKVESINAKGYLSILKHFKIDEGEASAFALCTSRKYRAVLTDDKELIKLCKIEGVPFLSAMAIVIMLFKKKVVSKRVALEKMEKLQGYGRYSIDVYNYFKSVVK